jgi:hypothetical protein
MAGIYEETISPRLRMVFVEKSREVSQPATGKVDAMMGRSREHATREIRTLLRDAGDRSAGNGKSTRLGEERLAPC